MLREDKQVCSEGTSPKALGSQARSVQPVPGPGTNAHPRTMTGRGISQLQQVNSHATVKRHRNANYFTPSLPGEPAGMRSDSLQGTWPPSPPTSTAPTALPAQRAGRTEPRTGFQGKNGNLTLFSSTPLQQGKKQQPQESQDCCQGEAVWPLCTNGARKPLPSSAEPLGESW